MSFAVDGRHRRCHQDQVRKRISESPSTEVTLEEVPPPPISSDPLVEGTVATRLTLVQTVGVLTDLNQLGNSVIDIPPC